MSADITTEVVPFFPSAGVRMSQSGRSYTFQGASAVMMNETSPPTGGMTALSIDMAVPFRTASC